MALKWVSFKSTLTVVHYEHESPGDLVHIDTKKLGRIERLGHRIMGNRRDTAGSAGSGRALRAPSSNFSAPLR